MAVTDAPDGVRYLLGMTVPEPGAAVSRVESARWLYKDTIAWYQNADSKAQVLLGLDGAFIAFLTATIFRKPDDLYPILLRFGPESWVFLALMTLTLAGSILSSVASLWSRIHVINDRIKRIWHTVVGTDLREEHQQPTAEEMWFFGGIGRHEKTLFLAQLLSVEPSTELAAITGNIFNLARNVTKKHRWVDLGFLLAGATLFFFLCSSVSYLVRVFEAVR